MQFQTLPGVSYLPEVSSDFVSWSVPRGVVPIIAKSMNTSFTDSRASGFNFYRAKALP